MNSPEKPFALRCLMHGFDLQAMDDFIDALGPCAARDELLERRLKARDAAQANNQDAFMRHIEFMHLRKVMIEREEKLRGREL